MRSPAWGTLALVLAALAGPAQAACALRQRAEVPLRVRDGFPFIPATIGDTPVTLLLDTGAQGILLTPDAAAALRLQAAPGPGTRLLGTGGTRVAPNVILRDLAVGGAAVPDSVVPVAVLPGVPRLDPPLAGLLGAPLLAAYDVDLDVPHGRMGLYDAKDCGAVPPPVPPPLNVLRLEMTPDGDAAIPVEINGQGFLALLDTGSRATILTEQAAQRLGLAGPASANLARGVDGTGLPVRHMRVQTMRVGTDVVANAPVSVSALQLGLGDMLLGLDYLGRRRVWISYRSGRVTMGGASPP